ncbi:uncharacterized protein CTHT_0021310 [Thermochaetoides thermophila DSM 1495]|uniref:Uncharacterized protein n=1 Tax=Chaetomium thermophilum (strain DSM 1495 / CBS 144.50 / IMI 039719) TaxID=759272 RepID=G0S8D0_CHATD|nr:hypothetical protein CTHT_0021310 [Thermochaetoides thermophila DSM 1495]EGS20305.1 hypothetical protein CTHT_0021310 [Thermochaetoides thermophila DSM 1495]
MLAPAQYIAGVGTSDISNLGFLAYNIHMQYMWYRDIINPSAPENVGPLCLLIPHFNVIYAISYVGGVSSRNHIWLRF